VRQAVRNDVLGLVELGLVVEHDGRRRPASTARPGRRCGPAILRGPTQRGRCLKR
jgi:hypothetical protein